MTKSRWAFGRAQQSQGRELCDGSGTYDPLPKLLELTDDKAAEGWMPKSCQAALVVYNPDLTLGGVISWLEIAGLFRERVQVSLF